MMICLVDAGISGRLHLPQSALVGVPIDVIDDFLGLFYVQVRVHAWQQTQTR